MAGLANLPTLIRTSTDGMRMSYSGENFWLAITTAAPTIAIAQLLVYTHAASTNVATFAKAARSLESNAVLKPQRRVTQIQTLLGKAKQPAPSSKLLRPAHPQLPQAQDSRPQWRSTCQRELLTSASARAPSLPPSGRGRIRLSSSVVAPDDDLVLIGQSAVVPASGGAARAIPPVQIPPAGLIARLVVEDVVGRAWRDGVIA